jgi:hypothetical protein
MNAPTPLPAAPAERTMAGLNVSVDVLVAAIAHTADPAERLAYREAAYLVEHPEVHVSTDADYPGWTPGMAVAPCWCGHPRDRHWTAERMTLGAGCHDCPAWDSAHAFGRELPWTPEAGGLR